MSKLLFAANIYADFSLSKRSVRVVLRLGFLLLDRYFLLECWQTWPSVKSCQPLWCISSLCDILKIRQMPTVLERHIN